jgi:hypothetical protein
VQILKILKSNMAVKYLLAKVGNKKEILNKDVIEEMKKEIERLKKL